jgi:hypothetical protein
MTADTNQDAAVTAQERRRGSARLAGLADGILAVVVGLSALVVHDVGYLLKEPFWMDEAWVAASVRVPLRLVPSLTGSTPLGWTLLLRLVPAGGLQRERLVPLAFAGLAAAVAYLLGRELRLTRYATGLLTGAAALLSPAMLIRDDLKQYTAEACACLMVWYLVARAENELGRRRLITLAAAVCVGGFFSSTLLFMGAAAMTALALECLIRGKRREFRTVVVVAAGMLVVQGAEYELLTAPYLNSWLHLYWAGFYIPTSSPGAAASFLWHKLTPLVPYLGFRSLAIDGIGVLAGIAALVWLRRYALAALFPFTMVAVVVASAAGDYPFGDVRTSTFWLVIPPVLMAIAVATAGHRIASATHRTWLAVVVAAVALAGWSYTTDPHIRAHPIPSENVLAQVDYVDSHFRTGDVIVVSYGAQYGFDYYYPTLPGAYVHQVRDNTVGWVPEYPQVPWIDIATGRIPATIAGALATARNLIDEEPAGQRGHVWIIESHLARGEAASWKHDMAGRMIAINVGRNPLWLYTP